MLTWNTTPDTNHLIHSTQIDDPSEKIVKLAIEACTDKAVSLLKTNIQDASLYLLFEWDAQAANLIIVVTDATKTHDSHDIVKAVFNSVANNLQGQHEDLEAYANLIKFWLHDYLTTCSAFFSYSLVAIFHSSTRANTELL
ncbi:MAG: hypothetical protein EOO53_04325 [Gammaproteobacteria bacterium]|nr:MAG: hypothetical protein EOO53_04325 [Gammaproteobacteria bacterium]